MSKWVFGYASLMWDPGFEYEASEPALVYGYHRALCVYSHLYRGTPDKPGLVAGLLPGGACKGRAFRVTDTAWPSVKQYLHDREMIYGVYRPRWMTAQLAIGREQVYGFAADPAHDQYAGRLPESDIAVIIRNGEGVSGSGLTYVENLIDHLKEMNIHDPSLQRIAVLARQK